jgi:hypothetical protein
MAKEKSLVEEAIIQMKNLEEAVAENAKGILASTMKEEIKELVKESLSEQEIEDVEVDTDVEMEEPEMEEPEMGDDEEGMEMDTDNIDVDDTEGEEEDTIDLTDEDDDDEILRVFSLMGPEDNIVVTKDDSGNINLKDSEKEYMIVGEGEELGEYDFEGMDMGLEEEEDMSAIIDRVFNDNEEDEDEFSFNEYADDEEEYEEEDEYSDEIDEDFMGDAGVDQLDMEEEIMYEIEFNEEYDELEEEEGEDNMGMYSDVEEGEEGRYAGQEQPVQEAKMSTKPKGVGMGSPKFKYSNKPNTEGGFKTVKKTVNKTMGTGKAKFEYKEGENLEGDMKPVKKMETKEASRTYASGSKKGRGLRKGITPNRNLTFESADTNELQVLREKNEEYRKALNIFRNKLNEVAVFNSNLAYATRLFTEHSTSKQEKINILRRFDGVETIKESKNLYKTLKDELSVKTSQPMNESIERKIENVQSTGSAINLIESKTYENPQFLRMKDLMSKLK